MGKYNSRSEVPDKYKMNLTDFFKNESEFEEEFKKTTKMLSIENKYVGKLKDANLLYEYLKKDIELETKIENLYVYAMLLNDLDLGKSKNIERLSKVQNLYSQYVNSISFFKPELLSLTKEEYEKLYKENSKLEEYKFALDEIYKDKKHVLSEKEEIIINELNNAMNNFSEMSSTMLNSEHDYGTITIDGKKINIRQTNIGKLLKNRNKRIRKKVYESYKKVLNQYGNSSAMYLDSYVKESTAESKIRKFNSAWEEKLFYLNMPNEAYEILLEVTQNSVSSLQRYFKIYKRMLNLKELNQYDLNLELSKEKEYTIEEGIELIRNSLKPLGNKYLKHFDKIISNNYIDFCEYKGKCSGGYSVNTADHDSRILLSYNNDLKSISTIAHECGHNVHFQLINENNSMHYRNVSVLVSEVASLTNECLLSNYLVNNAKDKDEKIAGLDNILGVFISNLFGAVREAKMEQDFYNYVLEGNTITKDYMDELTINSLKKYYGKEVKLNEYSNTSWITRSHYYNDFYLYSYAFCISIASYVSKEILNGNKNMLEKYIKFLSTGSNIYPKDAFKILGIDITNKKVYEEAVNYFDSLLDELEKISKE